MKHPSVKCARWQRQWRSRLICIPAAILFCVLSAQAQIPRSLPEVPVGGPGGGEFVARCSPGQLLGGVELRAGDDVDAIRPLCRTPLVDVEKVLIRAHYDVDGRVVLEHYESRTTYGVNGAATANTDWYGGSGGGIKFLVCPSAKPIVSAIYVEAEGVKTVTVNRITLLCEGLTYGAPTEFRDRKFWQAMRSDDSSVMTFEAPKNSANEISGTSICPVSRDNYATLAVGIRGRSGVWLDAMGLICDYPKLPPAPIEAIGRVTGGAPTGPPLSICEAARAARARNSPAAPGLEAQCRAAGVAGETPPVKAVGRVKGETPTDAQSLSICDAAREARARNSPAAPGLEEKCRADLAAKGAAIAKVDPELAEARVVETDPLYQQGFDIATAIFGDPALDAQGNTAMGPGSEKIRDSLSPVGQRGFNASVKLHLSRNYKR